MARNATAAQTIAPALIAEWKAETEATLARTEDFRTRMVESTVENYFFVNPNATSSVSTAFLTREVTTSGQINLWYTDRNFKTVPYTADDFKAKWAAGYFTTEADVAVKSLGKVTRNVDFTADRLIPRVAKAIGDAPEMPAL